MSLNQHHYLPVNDDEVPDNFFIRIGLTYFQKSFVAIILEDLQLEVSIQRQETNVLIDTWMNPWRHCHRIGRKHCNCPTIKLLVFLIVHFILVKEHNKWR